MSTHSEVPETHVLAIASHVTSGYVGNTMATFCMQTLGCEVSAIHTVNYSNHVGYRQFKGRKSSPEEVSELWTGLKNARLDHFDMMLSGYCPSAALVEQVGKIARELKSRAYTKPGSFFWVLDPVMGDNGRIYVAEDTVPMYKSLLRDADLILPNQFEVELLSEIKIHDLASMKQAIAKLHHTHRVPHVLITSIRLPPSESSTPTQAEEDLATTAKLSVIGSTATSDMKPRLFRITVPALAVFFSGTGDMFASLMVARLRQAAEEADLLDKASWRSPDDVTASDLPLAKAAEMVLASMHATLKDTAAHYEAAGKELQKKQQSELNEGKGDEASEEKGTQRHLALTRAAEVRVVRNVQALVSPPDLEDFKAQALDVDADGNA
ncbi:putative pyridoxal kinase [Elasticomyces elasticus]|nr:putative pyridoxal kinase [Elasticomyces elasticus]KAK3663012.1 putative pyridoxal kinase [Elasticomyces elasticus]